MKISTRAMHIVAAFALILTATAARAAGGLDTSFGQSGQLLLGAGTAVNAAVMQSDGKLLLAGFQMSNGRADFLVARMLPDGTLDPQFGSQGRLVVDFAGGDDRAQAVAVAEDGSIVVAGCAAPNAASDSPCLGGALIRLDSSGKLNSSFGANGKVTTPDGHFLSLRAIAIQSDGRIVAVGSTASTPQYTDMRVTRFNTDGTLDLAFGTQGSTVLDWAGRNDEADDVAIAGDGGILVAGSVEKVGNLPSGSYGPPLKDALVRLKSTGAIDAAFGIEGWQVYVAGGALSTAYHLAVEPDGSLFVASASTDDYLDGVYVPSLERVSASGVLDPSSLGAGRHALAALRFSDPQFGVSALQADGSSWVASGQGSGSLGLARVLADGSVDLTVGQAGLSLIDAGSPEQPGEVAAVKVFAPSLDRLWVTGTVAGADDGTTGFVARYRSDDPAAGTIGFAESDLVPADADTAVTLSVHRTGDSSGSLSAHYATVNVSAESGIYTDTSGQLSWADGDATDRQIVVPIDLKNVPSSGAQFLVRLTPDQAGGSVALTQVLVELPIPAPPVNSAPPPTAPATGGGGGALDMLLLCWLAILVQLGHRTRCRIGCMDRSVQGVHDRHGS